MEQMGKVLPWLVYQVAHADPTLSPLFFAKWDIKDKFWHLVISTENAWHFCYLILKLHPDDLTEIMVPMCLQMGWCKSPPLFCTASETAWDIAQEYLDGSKPLVPHKLEELCMPPSAQLPQLNNEQVTQVVQALNIYMDDFIGLSAGHMHEELFHFTQAVLHGIHTVFPPPEPTEDQDNEPISVKKLKQGNGLW